MATNRISTTVEAGLKYDIDFGNWTEDVQGVAQFTFGNLSKKSTGLVKATNKFLKILLTRQGSDPFNTNLGTYLDEIQYRGGESEEELGTFISEQINTALSQMQEIQADNVFPENENLITASLLEITRISSEKIRIVIKVVSEAGEGTTVTVPIIGG